MHKGWIRVLWMSALLLPLSACVPVAVVGVGAGVAVATDSRTSATYLADSEIQMRAAGRIRTNFPTDTVHVNVSSFNRVALLTGQVPDAQTRQQVEDMVRGVPDVTKVYNQLEIGVPTDFSTRSNDVYLSGKVNARFMDAGTVPVSSVKVVTEHGVVYLMGQLTQGQADSAVRIARTTSGVNRVVELFDLR